MNKLRACLFALLLLGTAAQGASAQDFGNWGSARPHLTRAELNDLLIQLDAAAASGDGTVEGRAKAGEEAAIVRERLANGDIRVGDQVALSVEGETALSQTFTVRPGQILSLPGIGDVEVGGLLRSELEEHLSNHLGKFIRDPVVRAESMIRITVNGAVAAPGFHHFSPDRLLSDAIMQAGGPAMGADLNRIYIQRAGVRIWDGEYLQQAMASGRTLDQLSLQAGDQVVIPAVQPRTGTRLLAIWTGVASSVALLLTIITRTR